MRQATAQVGVDALRVVGFYWTVRIAPDLDRTLPVETLTLDSFSFSPPWAAAHSLPRATAATLSLITGGGSGALPLHKRQQRHPSLAWVAAYRPPPPRATASSRGFNGRIGWRWWCRRLVAGRSSDGGVGADPAAIVASNGSMWRWWRRWLLAGRSSGGKYQDKICVVFIIFLFFSIF